MATGLKFLGIFFASLCLAEGHRDPRDRFWREGAHNAPSGPFFHTHVFCPCPRLFFLCVFFCFFRPLGPANRLDSWTLMIPSETPGILPPPLSTDFLRELRETLVTNPLPPPPILQTFCGIKGKCCPFFPSASTPP